MDVVGARVLGRKRGVEAEWHPAGRLVVLALSFLCVLAPPAIAAMALAGALR